VFGEAGPEAIMPLTRGADGSLGVSCWAGIAGGTERCKADSGKTTLSVLMPKYVTGKPDDATMQALIEGMLPGNGYQHLTPK
jgi:hypothetical protein